MKKIGLYILLALIAITIYIVMQILADKRNGDKFEWGYWTGLAMSIIIDFIIKSM